METAKKPMRRILREKAGPAAVFLLVLALAAGIIMRAPARPAADVQKIAAARPEHSRTNYEAQGHYLLFSGDYNETYGTDDLWLTYCDDTDYLTLIYDCDSAGQTEWSVLGWGGSLNGNWIGGPTYATGPKSGTQEMTVQFSVKFLRRMMGLAPGEELAYMALGAWNGGRIKSLTLHRGYRMERSPTLYTGGCDANESWRCTDIEQILDAPDDSCLYVRYTCTGAQVPNAYVLGWGAGVNGGWVSGPGYQIEGLAARKEYTVAIRMDEFRRSLGLGWDAKIDSLVLSACNNGKILAVWLGAAPRGEAAQGNSGSVNSAGGSPAGPVVGLAGPGVGPVSPGAEDADEPPPAIVWKRVEGYTPGDSSVYGRIVEMIQSASNWKEQFALKTVPGAKEDACRYSYYQNDFAQEKVQIWYYNLGTDDSGTDQKKRVVNFLSGFPNGFLVVECSGDKPPELSFSFTKDSYYTLYNAPRPWGTVSPVYFGDGKAVFSCESIRRAVYGKGDIKEIDLFQLRFAEKPPENKTNSVYLVTQDDLKGSQDIKPEELAVLSEPLPIAEMEAGNFYEFAFTRYHEKAHPYFAEKMKVTLTFDREVSAKLWFVDGGEGKEAEIHRQERSGNWSYAWSGKVPDQDYLCIMVEKVLSGTAAKLLDIAVDVKEKTIDGSSQVGSADGTFKKDEVLPPGSSPAWRTGTVTFRFAAGAANIKTDGMPVQITLAGATHSARIQGDTVTLTDVPLSFTKDEGYEVIISGAGYQYIKLDSVDVEALQNVQTEGGKDITPDAVWSKGTMIAQQYTLPLAENEPVKGSYCFMLRDCTGKTLKNLNDKIQVYLGSEDGKISEALANPPTVQDGTISFGLREGTFELSDDAGGSSRYTASKVLLEITLQEKDWNEIPYDLIVVTDFTHGPLAKDSRGASDSALPDETASAACAADGAAENAAENAANGAQAADSAAQNNPDEEAVRETAEGEETAPKEAPEQAAGSGAGPAAEDAAPALAETEKREDETPSAGGQSAQAPKQEETEQAEEAQQELPAAEDGDGNAEQPAA